ncbi:hypothetical protein [Sphingomonas sp. Mn802worker]|uniref:hypothetical protein n=1 Tax=Sphingomonas sp. Mn802worker TaxID=629773 RepID=UPI00036E32A6|nr:hypothetical protein [Sphingomonas sp. Mn802worker]
MRSDLSPFHFVALALSGAALLGPVSVRATATAYGARLNAKGLPANTNPTRINNRISSRLDNRLSLRIERYRLEASANPTAAFQAATTDDKSRTAPVIAPPQPINTDAGGQ